MPLGHKTGTGSARDDAPQEQRHGCSQQDDPEHHGGVVQGMHRIPAALTGRVLSGVPLHGPPVPGKGVVHLSQSFDGGPRGSGPPRGDLVLGAEYTVA